MRSSEHIWVSRWLRSFYEGHSKIFRIYKNKISYASYFVYIFSKCSPAVSMHFCMLWSLFWNMVAHFNCGFASVCSTTAFTARSGVSSLIPRSFDFTKGKTKSRTELDLDFREDGPVVEFFPHSKSLGWQLPCVQQHCHDAAAVCNALFMGFLQWLQQEHEANTVVYQALVTVLWVTSGIVATWPTWQTITAIIFLATVWLRRNFWWGLSLIGIHCWDYCFVSGSTQYNHGSTPLMMCQTAFDLPPSNLSSMKWHQCTLFCFCSSISIWGTHLAETFLNPRDLCSMLLTFPDEMPTSSAICNTVTLPSSSTSLWTAATWTPVVASAGCPERGSSSKERCPLRNSANQS